MKKTVLQIAAALLLTLSLSSCSQLLSDALKETEGPTAPVYTGDETQPTGADTPSDAPTETTEPEKPEMLGYDENGFSLWPEGNYLADPKFDTDEFLPDFDVDNNFLYQDSGVGVEICTTGNSIYTFGNDPSVGQVLMYTDRATRITVPLCGRPECAHDSTSCNAYIGTRTAGLRVYDGRLWWVDNSGTSSILRRMDLDGTDHEELERMDSEIIRLARDSAMIHRGYVYFSGVDEQITAGEPVTTFKIFAKPLDGGDTITILQQPHPVKGGLPIYLMPMGNDIFILLGWTDPTQSDGETAAQHIELYRWSSKTRKAQRLFSTSDELWYASYALSCPCPVAGDGLYFVSINTTPSDDAPAYTTSGGSQRSGYISEYDLNRFSFETGEVEKVSSFNLINGTPGALLTRDHIIAAGPQHTTERKVSVFDYNGELVLQADLEEHLKSLFGFRAEDSENVYIFLDGKGSFLPSRVLVIPLDGGEVFEIISRTFELKN